uniref:CRAL-TRIO domain-containing protein n=1 Tax=Panagrellus redivivus TaxID=6233 RepID=A0A7E4UWR4_PANRE
MWSSWTLSATEIKALTELQNAIGPVIAENRQSSNYCNNPFNLLRWTYAYEGDVELAAKKLVRHLRIRELLDLDNIECMDESDGVDDAADGYAPMNLIGRISASDPRILIVEQPGQFDLQTMMKSIRITAFMLNRFRTMERFLQAIQAEEVKERKMSSAVMIIDLEGLAFQSNLIGFISGPYRILWGTLIEQYPYLISQILIVNTPSFMSVIWNACSAFIPAEYRKKIQLLSASDSKVELQKVLPTSILPRIYGGANEACILKPVECKISIPKAALSFDEMMLEEVIIPAGSFVVHTFNFTAGDKVEFFIKHETEFTMNMFYHAEKQVITKPSIDAESMEEAYAGCERPGLPTLDHWNWVVPKTGHYHTVYGNEKAWIMSVQFKYQVFKVHENGLKIKVCPISS